MNSMMWKLSCLSGVTSQLAAWMILLLFHLQIGCIASLKHSTIYLGRGTNSQKEYIIDGATLLSGLNMSEWTVLVPSQPRGKFLIQFESLNIPCNQMIQLMETDDWNSKNPHTNKILNDFCGSVTDLFPPGRFESSERYMRTRTRGYGLKIVWSIGSAALRSKAEFRIIVTSFTDLVLEDCDLKKQFVCDRMCISRDLLCDGINHCLDHSDEKYNCSGSLSNQPVEKVPICLPSPCGASSLSWHFHHNTLTFMVPMVLALVFLSVAILWRNKRLLRRLIAENRSQQRQCSPSFFESSEIATAEAETFYHPDMPEVRGNEPLSFDPNWGIQLPPPYSPREDGQILPAPFPGDPPPLYEEVVRGQTPRVHLPQTVINKVESSDDHSHSSDHDT